jgi:acetyl-CoA carboxylase biotin carboxyl carrier protein
MAAERKPTPIRRDSMGKLNVDPALIERLAELLQRTGLTEIELAEGDAKVRVARAPQPAVAPIAAKPELPPAAGSASLAGAAQPAPAGASDRHPGAVRAPMVGTVYLTPEPGAPPFVDVGAEIREGQTLLIIEAMKVMNPIRAPRGGRVANVMVSNGDPVEYGELLLIIE